MTFRSATLLALLLAGCATQAPSSHGPIDAAAIARHVEVLASDAFEGRAPGTAGETKTVTYIVDQMKAAGLQPGNHGSWFQEVPLVEVAPSTAAILRVEGKQGAAAFEWGEDAVITNPRMAPNAQLNGSDLVFVGYGIEAPDRGWNDFAGVDLRGKTAVMLAGVPETLKGAAQLGASAAKTATAARLGAAGALVILAPDYTEKQWDALVAGARHPEVHLEGKGGALTIDARLLNEAADRLFAASGHDYAALRATAGKPGFKPVPLGSRASVRLDGQVRHFKSKNVIGLLPGAKRPDEYVLFLAHWDHLGRCAPGKPDPICNGAVDNASGVGGLLELANAFAKGKRPERSILFMATTAEEANLLGTRYYAEHPVVPLARTVAGLGADTIAIAGPADVVVLGAGLSPDLDRLISGIAARQGRKVIADKASESFFERSDHYPLSAAGVPVLIATSIFAPGAQAETAKYFAERYHKPSDEYRPDLRFDGAALDMDLAYRFGLALANSRAWPAWKPGTPYAAARAKQR